MNFVLPPAQTSPTTTAARRRTTLDPEALARSLRTFSDLGAALAAATGVDGQVDFDLFAESLDRQVAAADRWRHNLVVIAGRFGLEAAELVAALGSGGAELAETLAYAALDEAAAAIRSARLAITKGP